MPDTAEQDPHRGVEAERSAAASPEHLKSKARQILRHSAYYGRRELIDVLRDTRAGMKRPATLVELVNATLARQGVEPNDPFRAELSKRLAEAAKMRVGELKLLVDPAQIASPNPVGALIAERGASANDQK